MKINLNPTKECFIDDIVNIDITRITKIGVTNETALGWCNGLLFYLREFDDEYFNKKHSEGIWHIELVVYSVCEKIPEILKHNGFQVEIIDFTDFPAIEELTKSIPKLVLLQ